MPSVNTICICGAGTMGTGIAQVFAMSGFTTILFDINRIVLEKARDNIGNNLQYLSSKEKITLQEKQKIIQRLQFSNKLADCKADLIIEAIVEKIDAKVELFNKLAEINGPQVIFATNTSSLSITEIQKEIVNPERVVGMHFFNPAPVMKLVEVIKGKITSTEAAEMVYELCKKISKMPVLCKDSPGFIVNRIARHYYLEALKLVESGLATIENVDKLMEASGFKMGPFKLMDLIGMDINLSVSQSIYHAFNRAERFKPSLMQIDKVNNNQLGKKTGQGFYSYPPV